MTTRFLFLALLMLSAPVAAQFPLEDFAQTQCGRGESVFRSGVENDESADARPSGGKGVAATGPVAFDVLVPDHGRLHAMLLHVPANYDPARAAPLVIALHGSAASPPSAAALIRTLWQPMAELEGALILAPIATGSSGGWSPDFDTPAIACAIAEVERRYDIDRARRYVWGFSAGAHYGHALALANSTRFAAYAVNAGALFGFACGAPASPWPCETLLPTVARRIPAYLRVGTNDSLRSYSEGDLARLQAAGWQFGTEVDLANFVGAHTVGAADVAHAWNWFEGRVLPY